MGIGVSVFLLAVGAILTFAVEVQAEGFDINTVGVILMIVGCIGLLASMLFWDRMGFGGYTNRVVRDDYVVDDAPRRVVREPRRVVREREVVRQDDVL